MKNNFIRVTYLKTDNGYVTRGQTWVSVQSIVYIDKSDKADETIIYVNEGDGLSKIRVAIKLEELLDLVNEKTPPSCQYDILQSQD